MIRFMGHPICHQIHDDRITSPKLQLPQCSRNAAIFMIMIQYIMLKVIYLMADLTIEGKFTGHRNSLKGEKKTIKKGLTQHFTTLSNSKLYNAIKRTA